MQNYLPDWFDQNEFENFLTEGRLTQRAWVEGLKRWRRTKFMIRQKIRNTPMKYISRMMKWKHNEMANVAVQNARKIQQAKDMEEKIQSARNFIRQENVDIQFGTLIKEQFNKGSHGKVVEFGRTSPGQLAAMRNPTGDPKKKARLKKRIQRKRGINVESFEAFILEEIKKKTNQKKQTLKKAGIDIPGHKKREKSPYSSTDKNNISPTKEAEKGDFSDILVVETGNGRVKIISRETLQKDHKIILGKKPGEIKSASQLRQYLERDNFSATPTSKIIFGSDVEEKKKSEEKDKKQNQPIGQQKKKKKAKKKPSVRDMILPPERSSGPTPMTSGDAEMSPFLAQLATDPESLSVLLKNKYLTDEEKEALQQKSDLNPYMMQIGAETRQIMMDLSIQNNPDLLGKDLFLLNIKGKQSCLELSKDYKKAGVMDKSPVADILVVDKKNLNSIAQHLSPTKQECVELKKELLNSTYGISFKAGKSQLAATQAAETLAVVEEVKTLLLTVQENLPKEIFDLINDLNRLKNASGGRELFKTISNVVGPESNPQTIIAAQSALSTTTPIVGDIKKSVDKLMRNYVVKAAFVYAFATGQGKFDKDSIGKANTLFFANEQGEHVGNMSLSTNFAQAIQDKKFKLFVDKHNLNVSSKPGNVVPQEGRPQFGQTQPLVASYDPLIDDKLDNLFEYTFLPPDHTFDTLSPPSAQGMEIPVGAEPGMVGFSQFQEGDFSFNIENIFRTLTMLGLIDQISTNIVDYTDVGMQTSALESTIKNTVTINGREYNIPVFTPDLDENFIETYDNLNEVAVQMVLDGACLEEVNKIFQDNLSGLFEAKRNYKREYAKFHALPEQRAKRSKRVLARRKMAKRLGKKAIRGKDIDHKDGNAMNNGDSNLRVRSINKNRADNGHSKKKINEKVNWWNNLQGSGRATLKRLLLTPGQYENIDPKLLKLLLGNEDTSR